MNERVGSRKTGEKLFESLEILKLKKKKKYKISVKSGPMSFRPSGEASEFGAESV